MTAESRGINEYHGMGLFVDPKSVNEAIQSVERMTRVVRVEQIPHTVKTKQQIVNLFSGIRIENGTKGIHFIIPNGRQYSNDAFIELATTDDFIRIQQPEFNHNAQGKQSVILLFFSAN